MHDQATHGTGLGERRYDLDWIRIGAFAVLIVYHVGMYYVTWDWHVKSPHPSTAIEPLMMLTSPWRMSVLFLISGVATGYLLARAAPGFLRQRSARLLVPLLFGMFVIVPPQSYCEVVEKIAYPGTYAEFWRLYATGYGGLCRGSDCLRVPTWNHLWFVAYLWVYTLLLWVLVRAAPGAVRVLRAMAERRLAGAGLLLWPIVYFSIARLTLFAAFPSTHALAGDWYNHALYAPVFVGGFLLAGTRAPWAACARLRWHALGLALLGWVFLIAYFGIYADDAVPLPAGMLTLQRVIYAAMQWLPVVAVAGFAYRHLQVDNAARRYLTTAIFPVYILHQTIIVVLAHRLKAAHLDSALEALLLIVATAAGSLLCYEAIRRVRWLRPLFGLPLAAQALPRAEAGPRRDTARAWVDDLQ